MKKRKTKMYILICLLLILSALLIGCNDFTDERESVEYRENEFFKYVVGDYEGIMRAIIYDFTPLGVEQEILIIPKEIDGIEVTGISRNSRWSDTNSFGDLKARKIYFPDIGWSTTFLLPEALFNSPHLELFIRVERLTFSFFRRGPLCGVFADGVMIPELIDEYHQSSIAANVLFKNNYLVNLYSEEYIAELESNLRKKDIYDEEELQEILERDRNEKRELNYGYAWIDYLIVGENLMVTPPEPEREGYNFDGWYFEEDCITKAVLSELVKTKEDIILYAKWIKE